MQRVDLGLASPHGAISLAALERVYEGAGGYATYDGATGEFKQQTREEFGRSLGDDIARAAFLEPLPSPPRAAAPLVVKLKTSADPHPELLELRRQPVQSFAEIMAQQKAGLGAGLADKPPAAAPAPAAPTATGIQTWISPKAQEEEDRAMRRAAELEKMAEERKAAYHKRRQEQLKDAGAPQCYKCSWYGHIARACKNEDTRPQCTNCDERGHEAPACHKSPLYKYFSSFPAGRAPSNNAMRRAEREYYEDLARERRAAARRAERSAAEAGKPAGRAATLADFLGDI